jgi:carbon-monoxide dehydrogenase large subunit
MDYCLPRADNVPSFSFAYNEVPTTANRLGVKGSGEAGAIGAPPAVINAIVDALSGFGIKHIDMPATPEKIWRIINSGTQQAAE